MDYPIKAITNLLLFHYSVCMNERKGNIPHYDIIGDIHGHADSLERLLHRMGYRESGGAYRHPEGRKALFVGDFVDRGPKIRRTIDIAHAMTRAGSAMAVLGNHEINAIGLHTRDAEGKPLRRHSEKNLEQHADTAAQFKDHPGAWTKALAWFCELPLYLDLPELRVVHAAWSPELPTQFPSGGAPIASIGDSLNGRKSPAGRAVKRATCGVEVLLPDGERFVDPKGRTHRDIRIVWWREIKDATYAGAIFPEGGQAPEIPVPPALRPEIQPYHHKEKPVFFGHYWMPENSPRKPLAPNVACVDYSVAKDKDGRLTAYRWQGESELTPEHFICER